MKKIFIPILLFLNIFIFIFCAFNLILIFKPSSTYEELQKVAEIKPPDKEEIIIDEEEIKIEILETDISKDNIEVTEPTINEEIIIIEDYQKEYDWKTLIDINSDIKGWLYVNDDINYPVVQRNNSYYLNHNFEKKWDSSGCLFFEQRVNDNTQNKIIHGHNVEARGTMFSLLKKYYSDTEYIINNPYIYYTPVDGDTIRYEVLAVMQPNITNLETVDYLKQDFDDFLSWIDIIKFNSIYFNDEAVINDDTEVLTLSTCDRSIHGRYGRFAVLFKIS